MSFQLGAAPSGPTDANGIEQLVQETHSWLNLVPAKPAASDAEELIRQMQAINAHRLRVVARQELSERFHAVVTGWQSTFESPLRDARVPLTINDRASARLLDAMFIELAACYKILLVELSRRLFGLASSGRALLPVFRTMQLLAARMNLAYRLYASLPKGLWQEMHELYQFALRRGLAQRAPTELGDTPSSIYREALLAAFAEPQRLERTDLDRLMQLSKSHAQHTQITAWRGQSPGIGSFIVRPSRDAPGSFFGPHRKPAPQQGDLLFSCNALIARLEATPQTSPQDGALLRVLVKNWTSKPARQLNRLRTHARVDIYIGLDRIWHFLSGANEERGRGRWIVTNESRNGFALMHTGESAEHVEVGDIVGLHAGNGRSCHVCMVRWVLSDNPEHVEVGLEEISSFARAATLHGADSSSRKALLLQESPSDAGAAAIVSAPVPVDGRWELTIGALDSKLLVRPRSARERTHIVQITDLEADC